MRRPLAILLVLASVGILVAGCTSTQAAGVNSGVFQVSTSTPTPSVSAPQGNPQALMDNLQVFLQELQRLDNSGNIQPGDLTGITAQAHTLLVGLSAQYSSLSSTQQQTALSTLDQILAEMATVVNKYPGPSAAGTPAPAPPASPATVVPTPTAISGGGVSVSQMNRQLQNMRTELMGKYMGTVSASDISDPLEQMASMLSSLMAGSSMPAATDVQNLLGNMARAMADVVNVTENYALQQFGISISIAPTGTPSAAVTPTAAVPGVVTTPSPTPAGAVGSPTAAPSGAVATPTTAPSGAMATPTTAPSGAMATPTRAPSGAMATPTTAPSGAVATSTPVRAMATATPIRAAATPVGGY